MVNVLLVNPRYSQAKRTKHPAKLCPVGLYKHYFYHKNRKDELRLVEGNRRIGFKPDLIKITSLYTYWSSDVFNSIEFYRNRYPHAKMQVGGILASLTPEIVRARYPFVEVHEGIDEIVEDTPVDWKALRSPVQIVHASRSCIRHCPFCGVKKIEKKLSFKDWKQVRKEIQLNDLVFFDNNFLVNPHHQEILKGISQLKVSGKVVKCEAQSGFDPRKLTQKDAFLLKKSRFKSIRISWDWGLGQMETVRKALKYLIKAGFPSKSIGVFMIYNWDTPFELVEQKRRICFKWNVQIFDCRYRPLNQLYDNYNPQAKQQTSEDYYIHSAWTDQLIRRFRRNVREQNIMIRFNFETKQQMHEWLTAKKKTGKLVNRKINPKQITLKKYIGG